MFELVEFSKEWVEPYRVMLEEASDVDLRNIGLESAMSVEEIYSSFLHCDYDRRWDRLIARDGKFLIGDINLFFGEPRCAEVNIFVRKEERRSGAASVALDHALDEARRRGISLVKALIRDENEAGRCFFKDNGFSFKQESKPFKQVEYHLLLD